MLAIQIQVSSPKRLGRGVGLGTYLSESDGAGRARAAQAVQGWTRNQIIMTHDASDLCHDGLRPGSDNHTSDNIDDFSSGLLTGEIIMNL